MQRLIFRAVSVGIPRGPFLLRSDRFLSSSLGLELDRWKLCDALARFMLRPRIGSTIVDCRHIEKTCGRFTKLAINERINVIFRSTYRIASWKPDDLIPLLDPEKGIENMLVLEHLRDGKDDEWRFCFTVEKYNCPKYYVKTRAIEEDGGETIVHILDDYGYIGALDNHGSPKSVTEVQANLSPEGVTQTLNEAGLVRDIPYLAIETMLESRISKFLLRMTKVAIAIALASYSEEEKMEIMRKACPPLKKTPTVK